MSLIAVREAIIIRSLNILNIESKICSDSGHSTKQWNFWIGVKYELVWLDMLSVVSTDRIWQYQLRLGSDALICIYVFYFHK